MSISQAKGLIKKKSLSERPYLLLTIYILLTSLLLYWQFIFGDNILAYTDWGYDTFHQYVPSYEFVANSIRNGSFSQYNFIYGFGTCTMTMFGRVADPFSIIAVLIGVVFGSQYIGACIVFVQIGKILSAGLLCYYYLRMFKFSKHSSMLVAYIYAFSGYMMTAGQHYFFSISPVINMLLLIMIEKILREKKALGYYLGISGAAAWFCFAGVQGALAGMTFCAIYFFVRVIMIYGKKRKTLIKKIGSCALFVVNGIFFSCFMFLPNLTRISGSTRLSDNSIISQIAASFKTADKSIIRSGFLRLFSNSAEGTVNSWSGGIYHWEMFSYFFSAIFILIIAQYLWITFSGDYTKKQKAFRIVPVGVVIFAIVNKFIPSYFNVFTYPNYRHAFIYLPLFALAFADTLDKIKKGIFNDIVNYITAAASCIFIYSRGSELQKAGNSTVTYPMYIAMGTIIIGVFLLKKIASIGKSIAAHKDKASSETKKSRRNFILGLSFLVMINLFAENYITLYSGRAIVAKSKEQAHMINEDAVSYIKSVEKDNFYRFETNYHEGRMSSTSYSFSLDIPTVAYYDTTISSSFVDFIKKICPSGSDLFYNLSTYDALSSNVGSDLAKDFLGIKYYTTTSELSNEGWDLEKTYDQDVKLYRNPNINSMGLLYDSYITESDANQLDLTARQYSLYDSVIISNPGSNTGEYAAVKQDFTTQNPDYVYTPSSISAYSGKVSNIKESGDGKSTFTVEAKSGTSVIIPINRSYIDDNKLKAYMSVVLNKDIIISYFCHSSDGQNWSPITPKSSDQGDNNIKYELSIPKSTNYIGIALNYVGTVDFALSSGTIKAEPKYTNQGIQLSNHNFGDTITGAVSTEKNSLLFLPVLFDDDWHAFIDDKEVEILRADYAFCALQIPAGQHNISLKYKSGSFEIGLVFTFISIAFSAFIIIIILYKKIMRKKNPIKKKKALSDVNSVEENVDDPLYFDFFCKKSKPLNDNEEDDEDDEDDKEDETDIEADEHQSDESDKGNESEDDLHDIF